jgi:hypothetical protein
MPSYPTTIVYPTLEKNPLGLKNLFKLFVSFLKMLDWLKSSLLMEPKAERTTVRKRTSIKRK